MRVLHTSDQHFDRDNLDKIAGIPEQIVQIALDEKVDLILSTGDIFHKLQSLSSKSVVQHAKRFIMDLAGVAPVLLIKGNQSHDAEGCLEIFEDLETEYPIFVSEKYGTVHLYLNGSTTQFWEPGIPNWPEPFEGPPEAIIHFMSYIEKHHFMAGKTLSVDESNTMIQEELQKIFLGMAASNIEGVPTLFAGHLNLLGARLSSGQTLLGQDIIVAPDDLAMVGADYYALGHIHRCQQVVPKSNMFYAGSMYHLNYGEPESKAVLIFDTGDELPSKHPLASIPMHLVEIEIIDANTTRETNSGFGTSFLDSDVRLRVHGTKEQHLLLTDERLAGPYAGVHSLKIERIVKPDERIRSVEITQAKTLREKLLQWGESIQREIPETVLVNADETERECP